MQEKLYVTPCGKIHYWVNRDCGPEAITLVFLPGLTIGCLTNRSNISKENTICWYGMPPAMALPGPSG